MTDIIIGAVLLLVVGGAVFYILREKKKGRRCIGCPYSDTCKKNKC